jgi:hypothetical protein
MCLDANFNSDGPEEFFELHTSIDYMMTTGPDPYYARLAENEFEEARRTSRHISGYRRTSLESAPQAVVLPEPTAEPRS